MSIGNEPTATRRGSPPAQVGARRGLPSWAQRRGLADAPAAQAVTAALLALGSEGWTTLHGPHRAGPTAACTGHVVVGPGGVVVVGVLPRFAGDDVPDAHADLRTAVQDAAQAAAQDAALVTALLAPRHRTAVRALVCAAGDVARADVLAGPGALVAHLRALPARLHPADVDGLAAHLDLHLDASSPDVLTTAALETDARVARRRVVRPLTAGRPVASGHPPTSGRLRVPGTVARPWAGDAASPALDEPADGPDVRTRGIATLALRAGVVVSTAWLAWVFTTTPLGLG